MKLNIINKINKFLEKFSPFKIKTDSKHELFCNNIDKEKLKMVYGEEDIKQKNFLNFGAGYRFKHFAFKNVDNFKGKIDIKWSPCNFQPINIRDNSIKLIYTSHMIEHLTFSEAKFMLTEFYRILKPDGGLRIVTPNIDIFHNAYINNEDLMFDKRFSIEQSYVSTFAARLIIGFNDFKPSISSDEIRSLFDQNDRFEVYENLIKKVDAKPDRLDWYNHISWWNEDRFRKLLNSIGFKNIDKSAYSQSKFLILKDIKYFDQTAPWYSIYIEAIK